MFALKERMAAGVRMRASQSPGLRRERLGKEARPFFKTPSLEPGTERYITDDPAREEDNLYAYVGNWPLVSTDPTGLRQLEVDDVETAASREISLRYERERGDRETNNKIRHEFERRMSLATNSFSPMSTTPAPVVAFGFAFSTTGPGFSQSGGVGLYVESKKPLLSLLAVLLEATSRDPQILGWVDPMAKSGLYVDGEAGAGGGMAISLGLTASYYPSMKMAQGTSTVVGGSGTLLGAGAGVDIITNSSGTGYSANFGFTAGSPEGHLRLGCTLFY